MHLLLLLLLGLQAPAAPAHLTFSAPVAVAQLDTGKLDGELTELAWSPDGTQLYLRTTRSDRFGNVQNRHYVLALTGKSPARVNTAPDWAAGYWRWKSAPSSPGSDDFRIKVESRQKTFQGVATPMGGDLAKGGVDTGATGPSVSDMAAAARTRQSANDVLLTAAGHVIGEWVNEPVVPGLTFGWAPASVGVLTFADRDHADQLTVLDPAGHTSVIDGTHDALLPAWSNDGTKLAFLQRESKKKYTLEIITIQ